MYQQNALVIACNWLTRLAWMNIAIIMLSILGLGIFGISPALMTACYMLRRYLMGQHKVTISALFKYYKSQFLLANKVGLGFVFILLCLAWYINKGLQMANDYSFLAILALGLIPVLVVIILAYLCSMVMLSIYEQVDIKAYILAGLAMMACNKSIALMMLVCALVNVFISSAIPLYEVFFGLSPILLTGVGMMWLRNEEIRNCYE